MDEYLRKESCENSLYYCDNKEYLIFGLVESEQFEQEFWSKVETIHKIQK